MYSNRQGRGAHRRERLVALRAGLVEHDDLAVLDVADIFGADDVERAGLRRQDRAAVEIAEHQRADAERIAGADQLLVGERDQRVGALDRAQRLDVAVDEMVAAGLRDEMQDHLGVGGRLHHGAVAHQLAAQRQAVGQVAVVGDGKAAGVQFGEQRLHVAQDGFAGGGVADVADGGRAGQAVDHLAAWRRCRRPGRGGVRNGSACRRRRRCRRLPGRGAAGRAGRAR